MSELWSGIDASEAEGRLRGLRRRISELDSALQGQQKILRDNPDSFAFKLSGESLLALHNRLQEELVSIVRYRCQEKIDLSLDGKKYTNHTANIEELGTFLRMLQKLFSSIGQALRSGPTLRGPIASTVTSATELKLAAVYPSSFGMTFLVPSDFDVTGNSLAVHSLEAMFQLFANSKDEQAMMRMSGELGARTFSHFRRIANLLNSSDTEIGVDWLDYTGTRNSWKVSSSAAKEIIDILNKITETKSEPRTLRGRLVGASLLRNRFEMLLDDQTLVEGKTTVELGDKIKEAFGTRCEASVIVTDVYDKGSDDHKTYYALTSVSTIRQ